MSSIIRIRSFVLAGLLLGAQATLAGSEIPVSFQVRVIGSQGPIRLKSQKFSVEAGKFLCGYPVIHPEFPIPTQVPFSKEVKLEAKVAKDEPSFELTGGFDPGACKYDAQSLRAEFTVGDDPVPVRLNVSFVVHEEQPDAREQSLYCNYDKFFRAYHCNPYKGNPSNAHYMSKARGDAVDYRFDLELVGAP